MDIIYLFVRKWKCQRAFRVLTFRVIGMVAFDGYIFLKLFDEYISILFDGDYRRCALNIALNFNLVKDKMME